MNVHEEMCQFRPFKHQLLHWQRSWNAKYVTRVTTVEGKLRFEGLAFKTTGSVYIGCVSWFHQ